MPPTDRAASYITMAGKDLSALKAMLDPTDFAVEVFGFHAQQAVEKALKAWIETLGGTAPASHNLVLLLGDLDSLGAAVAEFWHLVDLTSFAVQFQYELYDDDDDDIDRLATLASVQRLVEQVAARVGT